MHRRDILKILGCSTAAVALGEVDALAIPNTGAATARLNQAGYLPHAEKLASVPGSSQGAFQLLTADSRQKVFSGVLSDVRHDAASGDPLATADFSAFHKPGLYRLATDAGVSDPFPIGASVYHEPLRLAMRSFYGQRCGCAVDLGNGYKHAACHQQGAFHPSSGRAGAATSHGGWHDAGDYGRYVVNSGITTGTLLWAWEMYPETLKKLRLNIPESGGKLPDYLAEVRWNLEWMLSLQDEDGGVWHKQTSEWFCGFVMPEADTALSYVIGTGTDPYKSTCASADLAAVAAIAARCYQPYDAAFAAQCLTAARKAWSWARKHPQVTYENPHGVSTGGYGDRDCDDEVLWASAELWRTTGDAQYGAAVEEAAATLTLEKGIQAPSWGFVAPLGLWSYVLAPHKGSADLRARILEQTQLAATRLAERRKLNGYGNTLALSEYFWGSNSVAANQSLLLLVADHLRPEAALREAALGNLHYLLGRNCHGVSWVTQVGTRPFQHPHHRPSAADKIDAPWPGLLSGGPNAGGGDRVADKLPKQPPMRMWADDQDAYSLNEIAINWNAPLVFLLAAANAMV